MPGVSKGLRAEAKYNVILDFPHLGLHSAAATGNIGLVKYALEHGQPINSVLDGVLPLHAACTGGDDLVVRLLIEKGADVNAPRLPRKYSNDKNRDTSAPIVGTSGSTPLHFACANGHTSVVLTLLLHGAHPDRPDKHGVTPEMLARNNGWEDCANVLKQWSHNKDKDLRDREGPRSSEASFESTEHLPSKGHRQYCGQPDCRNCATRKRLRVKRSIDNALHMLKPSLSHAASPCPPLTPLPSTSTSGADEQPPSPAGHPLGEYTFYPTTPGDAGNEELPPRRPSLPHVLDVPRSSTSSRRPSILSGSNPASSSASSRRPRSAGTDAEQSLSTPHKVKGKVSLLNVFKKGNGETPESLSGSSSVLHSASPSPAPEPRSSSMSFFGGGSSRNNRSTDVLNGTPPDAASTGSLVAQRLRSRLLSESSGHSPLRQQETELHHTRSKESLVALGDASSSDQLSAPRSPPIRPILRAHGRSSSSGQSGPQTSGTSPDSSRVHSPGPSVRALRFDAAATSGTPSSHRSDRRRHQSRSPSRGPRGSTSYNSLRSRSPGSPWGMSFRQDSEGDISIPYTSPPADYQEKDEHGIEEEDEDEEYGKPVVARIGNVSSGSSSSSDDLVSPAQQEAPDSDRSFECPFSINNPVPDEADASVIEASSPQSNFLGIDGIDSRMRGDSLSSMSTNPSAYVVTPALSHMNLPPSIYSPPIIGAELPEGVEPEDSEEVVMLSFKRSVAHVHNDDEYVDIPQPSPGMSSPRSSTTTRSSRTSRPVDIDIRSISSHAQAEALVQQAEQRILEFVNSPSAEDVTEISPHPSTISVSTAGEGRTPLSARLAAYGQSLKIEQKFKEVEEKRNSPQSLTLLSSRPGSVVMDEGREWSMAASSGARGLDRTFSLEERHHTPGSRNGRVRRPHTAGGTPMSDTPGITVSREQSPLRSSHSHSHHQHSLSSAAALSTFESSAKSSIRLGGSGISISTPVGTTSITPPSSFLSPGLPMTKSISSSRSDPHSHSPLASGTLTPLTPLDRPRIIQRSRTPDPTEDRDYAVSPRPIGVPLSRYSTAPHDLNDLGTSRTSKQEREMARANKLTKMGFAAAAGNAGSNVNADAWKGGHKHRFGGIKTLVQSLTGKS